MAQFVPTVHDITATAARLTERTGRDDLTIGVMLGDAGYDSDAQTSPPPAATGSSPTPRPTPSTSAPPPNPATGDPADDASAREQMNHRAPHCPKRHALYGRRSPIVEPPNGWLKDRRGLRRFARRGLTAVQAELSLACAVTNLLKLRSQQHHHPPTPDRKPPPAGGPAAPASPKRSNNHRTASTSHTAPTQDRLPSPDTLSERPHCCPLPAARSPLTARRLPTSPPRPKLSHGRDRRDG